MSCLPSDVILKIDQYYFVCQKLIMCSKIRMNHFLYYVWGAASSFFPLFFPFYFCEGMKDYTTINNVTEEEKSFISPFTSELTKMH